MGNQSNANTIGRLSNETLEYVQYYRQVHKDTKEAEAIASDHISEQRCRKVETGVRPQSVGGYTLVKGNHEAWQC